MKKDKTSLYLRKKIQANRKMTPCKIILISSIIFTIFSTIVLIYFGVSNYQHIQGIITTRCIIERDKCDHVDCRTISLVIRSNNYTNYNISLWFFSEEYTEFIHITNITKVDTYINFIFGWYSHKYYTFNYEYYSDYLIYVVSIISGISYLTLISSSVYFCVMCRRKPTFEVLFIDTEYQEYVHRRIENYYPRYTNV